MGELRPIPTVGDVFADVRGEDRTMRVSWHADRDVVVVSLWAGRVCRGSFRLARTELPRLRDLLAGIDGCAVPAEPERPGAVTLSLAGDSAMPAEASDEAPAEASDEARPRAC